MPWDPARYRAFESERAAPFTDLLAMIERRPNMRVIDLGCGTGELTARLAQALAASDVVGIDSSAEMLGEAWGLAAPRLQFELGAIEDAGGEWDLVFSHAALQWVDDHRSLVPRLLTCVAPGGQVAVQLPSNHAHATHRLIVETAQEAPFADALGGWARAVPVLGIDAYATMLFDAGFERITAFEKVYAHVLEDSDALAAWTSGTALVPYMERLPEALRAPFMERYRGLLRQAFPHTPVFYPFRRTLFAATRPA
ncbi:MAG: methyltransferase domain-containing protein [Chloroflexi bacterium]|nr:methyltransferase domain-containing protein [Chloroflexota bacterium]